MNRGLFQICTSAVFRNSSLTTAGTFKRTLPCQVFSSCEFTTTTLAIAPCANAINYAMLSARLPCRMNYRTSVSSRCSFFTPLSQSTPTRRSVTNLSEPVGISLYRHQTRPVSICLSVFVRTCDNFSCRDARASLKIFTLVQY